MSNKSSLKYRLIKGIGANAYGQAITVLIQLASLPLFLSRWDLSTYGIWLTISAIPSYLSMADVGMVTVSGNRMTMMMGANDAAGANRVFQSTQLFVLSSCLLVAFVTLPMVLFDPFVMLSSQDGRVALVALIIGVLLSMAGGLSSAVFKATHRYALGTALDTTSRLLEWLGGIAGLLLYGSFSSVALGMLLVRVIALLGISNLSTKGQQHLSWGLSAATNNELHLMIKPSLGFMLFPIGNAFSFQGFTLLTAHLLGPAAVAIFNTYRTVARIAVQVTSIISHALWPEFSRLYGAGSFERLKAIFLRTAIFGSIGAITLSIMSYALSPFLLQIWTHGKIEFIPYVMALLLLYAAVGGSWHIPRVLLMSTNSHSRLGFFYLLISAFSLCLAWVFGLWMDLSGLALAMVIGELLMMVICAWMAIRHLNLMNNNFGKV